MLPDVGGSSWNWLVAKAISQCSKINNTNDYAESGNAEELIVWRSRQIYRQHVLGCVHGAVIGRSDKHKGRFPKKCQHLLWSLNSGVQDNPFSDELTIDRKRVGEILHGAIRPWSHFSQLLEPVGSWYGDEDKSSVRVLGSLFAVAWFGGQECGSLTRVAGGLVAGSRSGGHVKWVSGSTQCGSEDSLTKIVECSPKVRGSKKNGTNNKDYSWSL